MRITFHRTRDGGYHATARRNDGVVVSVPGCEQPQWLPDGLGHYVIERLFGLDRGLWACVSAGAMFPGMEVVEGTLKPGSLERSRRVIQGARQHPAEAEVMVAALTQVAEAGLDSQPEEARVLLKSVWQAPYRPVGLLKPDQVTGACDELRQARELWHQLPNGESLSLIW